MGHLTLIFPGCAIIFNLMKEFSLDGYISRAVSTLQTAEDLVRIVLNNKRPDLARELIVRFFTDIYFHTWELSPEARYHLNGQIIPDMIAGKKRSLGADGAVLLADKSVDVKNTHNIPSSGALLVTPDHYSGGHINGYGTHLEIARVILEETGHDIRYILQDSMVNPFTGYRVIGTKWLYQIMTDTYGMLRVPPPELKLKNGEATGMESLRAIRTSFKNGEVVGLYPELTGTKTIQEGHYLAGIVAKSFLTTTRGEGLILPVGVYEENGLMVLNFGKPYSASELGGFFRRDNAAEAKKGQQAAANYMMAKVNQLVPPRMHNPKMNLPL